MNFIKNNLYENHDLEKQELEEEVVWYNIERN